MDAKHQFKYTYNEGCEDFSPVEVTFDIPGEVTLSQMLYNFQSYLKACGFVFDGDLEIVDHTFDVMKGQDDIDELYGCMADWDKSCGCPTGPKGVEGERGLDNTSSPLESAKDEKIKEFNKELSKLEQEVKKNKWVHGICNPPSPDWVKDNVGHDGAASINSKLYSEWLNKNK